MRGGTSTSPCGAPALQPPGAQPTPSASWGAENPHKPPTSQTFPRFPFHALPSTAPSDELLLPCRSWRPLDSGWKLIWGDRAFPSVTSLTWNQGSSSSGTCPPSPPWSPCLARALKATSELAAQATARQGPLRQDSAANSPPNYKAGASATRSFRADSPSESRDDLGKRLNRLQPLRC